ncbi:hypothetical protein TNCV_1924161, partial [Trichonephila clavipes]
MSNLCSIAERSGDIAGQGHKSILYGAYWATIAFISWVGWKRVVIHSDPNEPKSSLPRELIFIRPQNFIKKPRHSSSVPGLAKTPDNHFQDESGHILQHPQRVFASLKVWYEKREYVYDSSQLYTSVEQHGQLYNKMDIFD